MMSGWFEDNSYSIGNTIYGPARRWNQANPSIQLYLLTDANYNAEGLNTNNVCAAINLVLGPLWGRFLGFGKVKTRAIERLSAGLSAGNNSMKFFRPTDNRTRKTISCANTFGGLGVDLCIATG